MKRPAKRKTARRAAEPPQELPPIAELDTLPLLEDEVDEADEAGPVRIDDQRVDDEGLDVRLTVTVDEMEKKAVPAAIEGPLRRKVERMGFDLRWQRVQVLFAGDAMIPTAAKATVKDVLARAKPLSVVVQRGYPDELVYEGQLPTCQVNTRPVAGDASLLRVEVDSGDLDAADLPRALEGELAKLTQGADGKAFQFGFAGTAQPDDGTRALLRDALGGAGAQRITVDGELEETLLDRALEQRVAVHAGSDGTTLQIKPGEGAIADALALVLPRHQDALAAKSVTLRCDQTPTADELAAVLVATEAAGCSEVAWVDADGTRDQLWPALLEVEASGGATTLTMVPGDRDAEGTLAGFRREAAVLCDAVAGKAVTLDWPAGTTLGDAVLDAYVHGVLAPLGPTSVACSAGGDDREPVLPPPLAQRQTDGERVVFDLDTEAGKPAELVRALQRALGRETLRGKQVAVVMQGQGTVSRSMLRALVEAVEAQGAQRLEVTDHGTTDILWPALLAVEPAGDGVRVSVHDSGHDEGQRSRAAARDLDAAEVGAGTAVTLVSSAHDDALIDLLVQRGIDSLALDGDAPVQVLPALFAAPARDGDAITLTANPALDDDGVARQAARELPALLAATPVQGAAVTLVWPLADEPPTGTAAHVVEQLAAAGAATVSVDAGDEHGPVQAHPPVERVPVQVLGQREAATPPLTLFGVEWTDDQAEVEETVAALTGHKALIDGRRVLVVYQRHGRDRAVEDDAPLALAVRQTLEPDAAALLIHRPASRGAPSHFEVLTSRVDGLSVGARVRDPRRGA